MTTTADKARALARAMGVHLRGRGLLENIDVSDYDQCHSMICVGAKFQADGIEDVIEAVGDACDLARRMGAGFDATCYRFDRAEQPFPGSFRLGLTMGDDDDREPWEGGDSC
jgi:hypothetical protein